MTLREKLARGPFRADQIRCGDPYELSDGHAILVAPTGGRGSASHVGGTLAIATDPDALQAGIDTGYAPEPGMLRAPDLAVGNVPDAPGWVAGVPPLALEYADRGQDEDELAAEVRDLLSAGTKFIWVIRMAGARRVEVYEPGQRMRIALPGELLEAPGVLRNPVPASNTRCRNRRSRRARSRCLRRSKVRPERRAAHNIGR